MENRNYIGVGSSASRLPPGLRFQPTDEELLFEYLRCKVFSLTLPASIIPEAQLFNFDPSELHGNAEEKRHYFFSKKEAGNRKQKRTTKRRTRCGYWKATGSTKQIYSPPIETLGMVTTLQGLKKTFVFHQGKSPKGCRTDWFMHEYSLVSNARNNNAFYSSCEVDYNVEEWVICHVFLKQRTEEDYDSRSFYNNEDDECSDNFYSTVNSMNVGQMGYLNNATYYCSSPASSSSSSVWL